MDDVTRILQDAQDGRPGATERLIALLYDELRAVARREMASERDGHTLQPTALVHEAYLRLVGEDAPAFESRGHFFSAAATAVRRVLLDHARNRGREKRGGGWIAVPLEEISPAAPLPPEELLDLDVAIERLASFDPEKARLVELRFFAGLSVEDVARVLGRSESSVRRDWRVVRAWLRAELERNRGD